MRCCSRGQLQDGHGEPRNADPLYTVARNFTMYSYLITPRAKHSGAVYCNRSCLWRAGGDCYHDNSKLRASIFTKLGLYVQVVTVSS